VLLEDIDEDPPFRDKAPVQERVEQLPVECVAYNFALEAVQFALLILAVAAGEQAAA
jgi:hypothetical protein